MTFDALAAAAVADELRARVLDGRVQEVVIPEPLALGLEIYARGARHYLYATACTDEARVQLVETRLRRGLDTPTPLLLLLRKYVNGARVAAVEQPGFERILRLQFIGPYGPVWLYAEVMGRHSNLILVDEDGIIMDAAKRIPARLSRRVVLPQHPYTPPPPQQKASFASLTPGRLAAKLGESGTDQGPLWRGLVATIAGLSPLAAREVVWRVTDDAEAPHADLAAVLEEIAGLMRLAQTGGWEPCVAWEGETAVAFAPYPLRHYPQREQMPTMSAAMTRYFAARGTGASAQADGYAGARQALQDAINAARERLQRQEEAIRRELSAQEARETLRRKGEWILASISQIQSRQTKLVVDWGADEPVEIALDAELSPAENAQRYFREYERLKAAEAGAPVRLEEVQLKLDYLAQLETDLMLASNRPEIDAVRQALVKAGHLHVGARQPPTQGGPGRVRATGGFLILVGKNSAQNEQLTFGRAKGHDLWLHARGVPGSHVIIVTEGREAPADVLQQAAELAAYYSRAREEASVEVDYTLQRNVRRIPHAGPGMVHYRGEKTLRVTPRDWLKG